MIRYFQRRRGLLWRFGIVRNFANVKRFFLRWRVVCHSMLVGVGSDDTQMFCFVARQTQGLMYRSYIPDMESGIEQEEQQKT